MTGASSGEPDAGRPEPARPDAGRPDAGRPVSEPVSERPVSERAGREQAVSGRPAVSVVTPVWNAAATLGEAVASVRAQSFSDWEMLLVDDGSTDGSGALAARLAAEDPRIRLLAHGANLHGANLGAAAARNHAIREARGRFIAFLDADDLWRPEKLALQLGFMRAKGHPLTFTAYRRIAADGRPLGIVHPPDSVTRAGLLRGNVIGCLTAVYDTEFFGKVEMPLLSRRHDYGLWLELLRHVSHAHALPQVLADYRVQPGSLSAGKAGAARDTWRFYREHERLPWLAAALYFAQYAVRWVAKRLGG